MWEQSKHKAPQIRFANEKCTRPRGRGVGIQGGDKGTDEGGDERGDEGVEKVGEEVGEEGGEEGVVQGGGGRREGDGQSRRPAPVPSEVLVILERLANFGYLGHF